MTIEPLTNFCFSLPSCVTYRADTVNARYNRLPTQSIKPFALRGHGYLLLQHPQEVLAQRQPFLSGAAAQRLMEVRWNVLDLKIRHETL